MKKELCDFSFLVSIKSLLAAEDPALKQIHVKINVKGNKVLM